MERSRISRKRASGGRRFKCKFCGAILRAWLPVGQEINGAMLLSHLSQSHRAESPTDVNRMQRTEDIGTIAAEALEVIEARRDACSGEAQGGHVSEEPAGGPALSPGVQEPARAADLLAPRSQTSVQDVSDTAAPASTADATT